MAIPSQNNSVKILDTTTGKEIQTLTATNVVEHVQFSPDGQLLSVSGDSPVGESNIELWSTVTGKKLLTIPGSIGLFGADFSPDNKLLRTGLFDEDQLKFGPVAIGIWDLEASLSSGKPQLKIRLENGDVLQAGVFSPDSQWLISANIIFNVNNGEVLQNLTNELTPFWGIFSPDGQSAAYGTMSGNVHISNISPFGNPELRSLECHKGPIYQIATNENKNLLVTAGFFEGEAHLWDLNKGQKLISAVGYHEDGISTVAINADGSRIATGSPHTPEVKVWDASSGEELATLEHGPAATDWVVRTGIVHVDFNPIDDRYLAAAGADGTARIWDWAAGEAVHIFTPHPKNNAVMSAKFSPDGSRLATFTTAPDALLKVWDANSGKELWAIPVPGMAWGYCFSSDGQQLAAGGTTGWLRMWDINSGKEIVTLAGHERTIIGVDLSDDESRLVTAGYDNAIRIWDTATGAEITRLSLLYGANSVLFHQDDTQLITSGSADGVIRFYTLDLAELVEIAKSRITRPFTLAECEQYRIEFCSAEE
ncbi:MAG: hypothetical protein DWQ04_33400 [Chloroflexi bacterium]|nr:MAG: hypothetical protein DWQ04_33400 [Chloroflexota bacterium]